MRSQGSSLFAMTLLVVVFMVLVTLIVEGYQLERGHDQSRWMKSNRFRLPTKLLTHNAAYHSTKKSSVQFTSNNVTWKTTNLEKLFFESIQKFFQELVDSFLKSVNQANPSLENNTPPPYIPKPKKPKNAVLVFGGTGRTGLLIVKQLEKQGRDVVVVGKNLEKVQSFYPTCASTDNSTSIFVSKDVVDVTNTTSLTSSSLYDGVEQVVVALGPGFGGSEGNNATSYDIDYRGVENIVKSYENTKIASGRIYNTAEIVSFAAKQRNLTQWKRLDDALMGGSSKSKWEEISWDNQGSTFARWEGGVITAGGGFCGTTLPLSSELSQIRHSSYDGIKLRIRGDGNRYKFRIKPGSIENEYQYQTIFDTVPNVWTEIKLPFNAFTAVRRNDVIYRAKPLSDYDQIDSIGFVFSKYNFNEKINPSFPQSGEPSATPVPFQLDVESISYYKDPRAEIVLVSSAGTERINKLQSVEETLRDIPIVQLNPQGILNWKYKGEEAVRASSLKYSIIRPTGLANATLANTTDSLNSLSQKRRLEVNQGDQIAGRITREELADAVVQVISSPYTVGKTFEIRRDESNSGLLVDPQNGVANNFGHNTPTILEEKQDLNPLFLQLIEDKDRASATAKRYLPPFPYANDPFSK